jgi:hypothetical protein
LYGLINCKIDVKSIDSVHIYGIGLESFINFLFGGCVARVAPRFREWGDKIISRAKRAKKFFDFVPPPLFAEWGGQKYKSIITVLHSVVNNNSALQVNWHYQSLQVDDWHVSLEKGVAIAYFQKLLKSMYSR